jgi:hypothetical protein
MIKKLFVKNIKKINLKKLQKKYFYFFYLFFYPKNKGEKGQRIEI